MGILDDFRSKDFMGQMQILGEIEKSGNKEAIPQLLELHAAPLNDDSIAFMIQKTLRAFLSQNEDQTVQGLSSDSMPVKKLCVQIAGENKFPSAGMALMRMADDEKNSGILLEILTAISEIKNLDVSEFFKKHIHHKNSLISALSIKMLGEHTDADSIGTLCDIVNEGEADDSFENCSIAEYKAIEALGSSKTEKALAFLCTKVHHRNASARRIIHGELVKSGPAIIPFLTDHFEKYDDDMKVMTADVLGRMGDKTAVDILVAAINKGYAKHHNVRQSIYEALGQIPSPEGADCLLEGLQTEDELLLLLVVTSLNIQNNPAISKKIKNLVDKNNQQSEKLIKAIVKSNSLAIFEALYKETKIADRMIDCITRLNDPEVISEFYVKLVAIGGERAEADAEKIEYSTIQETTKNILAIDDSRPMLLYYRSVAADMGIDIITAANGKKGLEIITKTKELDLLLTDMNMPEMDGIELTRQIRDIPELKEVPVIMVTTESDKSQERQAVNAGVNCVVMKPFTANTLQTKIKKLINTSK